MSTISLKHQNWTGWSWIWFPGGERHPTAPQMEAAQRDSESPALHPFHREQRRRCFKRLEARTEHPWKWDAKSKTQGDHIFCEDLPSKFPNAFPCFWDVRIHFTSEKAKVVQGEINCKGKRFYCTEVKHLPLQNIMQPVLLGAKSVDGSIWLAHNQDSLVSVWSEEA